MREWFILFLFLSLQLSGYNLLSGGHLYPPSENLSVSANGILTVPIGGSGTGEETGDGTETGTGTGIGAETGTATETGED
ncbi:MAG: hypothetical protein LC732_07715 [Acidobacteria bacterium]|nr:hypothetical protein [Acidobacteriota bacterium]